MEYQNKTLPAKVSKIGLLLLTAGVIIIGLSFVLDTQRAFFNYLMMYMFILSIGLGSLGLVALEYLTGASWSTPFRRVSEFLASVLPILIILVIPIFFGMHDLFHWSHHDVVEHDHLLKSKEPYLNVSFFTIRAAFTLLVWILFYYLFTKNSQKQDITKEASLTRKNIILSTVFAPLFMVTLTIAAIDFMMSLEPHWFSTIYGVYYFAGTLLASFAALTLITILLKENGYLSPGINNSHFYSMGTFMFAFIIFWGYIGFSQFLLIWYADIPEETIWYINRWTGDWKYVSIALIVIHFVIPFLVLLPRSVKTNLKRLKVMSVWILLAHMLDLYWLIMPTYNRSEAVFGWIEIGYPLFAVGLLILVFKMRSDKVNLMPVGDPKLQSGLNFHL